jgi:hypothetical protein
MPKQLQVSDGQCGTSFVLQCFLSFFDFLLCLRDRSPGFGLIGACLVEFFVPSLLLFAQSCNRSSESCGLFRIPFETLLNAEQL